MWNCHHACMPSYNYEDYFSSLIIKKGTMQNDPNEDARNASKFPIYMTLVKLRCFNMGSQSVINNWIISKHSSISYKGTLIN